MVLHKRAAARPDLVRASDPAGTRALECRERAGEGDSPCGRLSNSPLPSSQQETTKPLRLLLLPCGGVGLELASLSHLTLWHHLRSRGEVARPRQGRARCL